MKNAASHRKRTKSECDSSDLQEKKDLKDGHIKSISKSQHGGLGGQNQHGGHHGTLPSSQHHIGHHWGPQHHKGDHGRHTDHGQRDGEQRVSPSSHPFRTRRDTIPSRSHESDKRSTGTNEAVTPVVFYENTYKLIPDCKVHEGKVRDIILAALKDNIKETKYDPNMCGQRCQLISEVIKERMKTLNLDRFKIVCLVMIGQIFDQSMLVTSRCLWNKTFDKSISVEYKSGNIIAMGLVFAVYTE